ncbi:MAG: glutaredoxin family protein [Aquisalimonadaceae bacterium]
MKGSLLLYGTSHCHLCAQAEAILADVGSAKRITVRHVDIAEDDALMQRYGLRIPVLSTTDGDKELNWPFDHVDVLGLIESAAFGSDS